MIRLWRGVVAGLKFILPLLIFVVVLGPEWPAFQDERYKIDEILGQRHFDFFSWESKALAAKAEAALAAGQSYLTEAERKQIVLDYVSLLGEIRSLEAQVRFIYADPDVTDPELEAREFQEQADEKRAAAAQLQPIAEQVMQGQVASVLLDEGFDILGTVLPPVSAQMTPLPYVLVVSPRQEIQQIYNIPLQYGLTIPAQEQIESAILDDVDKSALVVPIGGLGIWPAMIYESGNINYLVNTIAHEWAHHWLTFHPLGISYGASPALRTMNETVASIFGDEIGARVIERYYPEYAPPQVTEEEPQTAGADEPPAFDFGHEMRETRNTVDELLAQGEVEGAETYMEQRRQFFWENGYQIRKLNQAYFAFYGAYADTPGEQGDDPIGPAVLAMRQDSETLLEFMRRVSRITSLEGLQEESASLSQLN
ncbi:MAG: hypothetical protein PVH65_05785 [Chloroflexota bacterium]